MLNSVHKRQHRHRATSPKPFFAHRFGQWCGIAILTLALFLTLSVEANVHARGGPTRRDRRPDREVRIRYPRSQPQSNSQASGDQSSGGQSSNSQGSGTVLQNAPPAAAPPSTQDTPSGANPTE